MAGIVLAGNDLLVEHSGECRRYPVQQHDFYDQKDQPLGMQASAGTAAHNRLRGGRSPAGTARFSPARGVGVDSM